MQGGNKLAVADIIAAEELAPVSIFSGAVRAGCHILPTALPGPGCYRRSGLEEVKSSVYTLSEHSEVWLEEAEHVHMATG